jgi:hypothetical protein
VIGDSIASSIGYSFPNIKRIASLSLSGQPASWLLGELKKVITKDTNVDNVVLSIGSNNGWDLIGNTDALLAEQIERIFPNAAYWILNGSYGWDNLKVTSKNTETFWEGKIMKYMDFYKSKRFKVVGTITPLGKHPAPEDNLLKSFRPQLSRL